MSLKPYCIRLQPWIVQAFQEAYPGVPYSLTIRTILTQHARALEAKALADSERASASLDLTLGDLDD